MLMYKILRKVYRKAVEFLKERDVVLSYARKSYSQEGEDILLERLFFGEDNGFYVDVGSHHPFRYSNTYLLYKKGWRGINIDAMPGSKRLFDRFRPRDINIEVGISNFIGSVEYYMFESSALNTFSKSLAEEYVRDGFRLVGTRIVNVMPLSLVLDKYMPEGEKISVMSIDVEGEDMKVLQSNDWNKYRPKVILIEILGVGSIEHLMQTEEFRFLQEKGYGLFAKTVSTAFFRDLASL